MVPLSFYGNGEGPSGRRKSQNMRCIPSGMQFPRHASRPNFKRSKATSTRNRGGASQPLCSTTDCCCLVELNNVEECRSLQKFVELCPRPAQTVRAMAKSELHTKVEQQWTTESRKRLALRRAGETRHKSWPDSRPLARNPGRDCRGADSGQHLPMAQGGSRDPHLSAKPWLVSDAHSAKGAKTPAVRPRQTLHAE